MIPIGKLGRPKSALVAATTLADLLKGNLAVLATLVAFCGLVATEAYYAGMGLRYQTLGLSTQHIAYRGLTAVFSSAVLFVIYVAAFMWLGLDKTLEARIRGYRKFRIALLPAAIVGFTVAGYFSARASGLAQAAEDLDPRATKLVRIVVLSIEPKVCTGLCDFTGYRLVHAEADAIYVVKPSAEAKDATRPVLKRIPKASIVRLELSGV